MVESPLSLCNRHGRDLGHARDVLRGGNPTDYGVTMIVPSMPGWRVHL